MQYSGGPHSLGDDYSTKVCSKRGSREDEGDGRKPIKKSFLGWPRYTGRRMLSGHPDTSFQQLESGKEKSSNM